MTVKRVLIAANLDRNILLFRRTLVMSLIEHGIDTHVCVPAGEYLDALQELGVTVHTVPFARGSLNPLTAPASLQGMNALVRKVSPDIVHTFTHQPNIFMRIAAPSGSNIVHTITGLGSGFLRPGLSGFALRSLFKLLYLGTSFRCQAMIFQNDEDAAYFTKNRLIGSARSLCIRGSGVDTAKFRPDAVSEDEVLAARAELGLKPEHVVCTLTARLLVDKGVREFAAAAKALIEPCPNARFLLVGTPDPGNPKTLSPEELAEIDNTPNIIRAGWRTDMPLVWRMSDVAVLPSYREGLPMSLQEALACGRPVVTTDVPGCREIVAGGEHGVLVPHGVVDKLAAELHKLIVLPDLREKMSRAARKKAVDDFDGKKLAQQHIELYNQILSARRS